MNWIFFQCRTLLQITVGSSGCSYMTVSWFSVSPVRVCCFRSFGQVFFSHSACRSLWLWFQNFQNRSCVLKLDPVLRKRQILERPQMLYWNDYLLQWQGQKDCGDIWDRHTLQTQQDFVHRFGFEPDPSTFTTMPVLNECWAMYILFMRLAQWMILRD